MSDEVSEQAPEITETAQTDESTPTNADSSLSPLQQQIDELFQACEALGSISDACEQVLAHTATLKNKNSCQTALEDYAHSLASLPLALQHLHDFRRHFDLITSFADKTKSELIAARGGADDALSSEETRVFSTSKASSDVVLGSIKLLEWLLGHVKGQTQPLLTLIAYDGSHFREEATHALRLIRVDIVSEHVHAERERIEALAGHLALLSELALHVEELASAA